MNRAQILSIYPDAYFAHCRDDSPAFFAFPTEDGWCHLKRAALSQTEMDLLNALLAEPLPKATAGENHPWFSFLSGQGKTVLDRAHPVQLVQFCLSSLPDDFEKTLWLDSFSSLFLQVEDGFFVEDNKGVVVIKHQSPPLLPQTIGAMIQLLEEDFSVGIACFLGGIWPVNDDLPALFAEEQAIFSATGQQFTGQALWTLPGGVLPYFLGNQMAKSKVAQKARAKLYDQPDMIPLVHALWANQGNLSLAAKSLYLHRNTVQYRLDKFDESAGLNLRNMDDLFFCRFLLLGGSANQTKGAQQ